jgi:hypothetical protein
VSLQGPTRNLKSKGSERAQPILPMEIGQLERRRHNYVRNGTLDLFAALNIATGEVLARCKPQHRAQDFVAFLREIEASVKPALEVHVVSDRLSAHRAPVVHRWLLRHPRFHLHVTPTYASWQSRGTLLWPCSPEKALRRGSHTCRKLRAAILAYVEAHNDKGKPFTWTKTADEILDKMRRFGLRTQQVHAQCHEPRTWHSRAGSFTWRSGRKFHQQVRDLFGHRDGRVMGTRQFAIAPKLGPLCHRGVLV